MKLTSILSLALASALIFSACKKKDNDGDDDPDDPTYKVGDEYGGGIVFHITDGGKHGLIAAKTDQSTSATWGCSGTSISGALGTAIGTGQANTTAIVNGCSTAGIAARICDTLTLNGFTDWYLPSQLELDVLHDSRTSVGNFSKSFYWSSSESASTAAYVQFFEEDENNDPGDVTDKTNTFRVRAVRSF